MGKLEYKKVMAAAPDLLDALKAVMPYIGLPVDFDIEEDKEEFFRVSNQAKEAIRKATE